MSDAKVQVGDAPTPDVKEVTPLELIEILEKDLRITQTALAKVIRIDPQHFPGGSSNKNFGKRYIQALAKAKAIASDTLMRLESHVVPE